MASLSANQGRMEQAEENRRRMDGRIKDNFFRAFFFLQPIKWSNFRGRSFHQQRSRWIRIEIDQRHLWLALDYCAQLTNIKPSIDCLTHLTDIINNNPKPKQVLNFLSIHGFQHRSAERISIPYQEQNFSSLCKCHPWRSFHFSSFFLSTR